MNRRRRFRRVSSFLADITRNVAVRRYHGGIDWKKSQALLLALNSKQSA
jgi:hypothetical protein